MILKKKERECRLAKAEAAVITSAQELNQALDLTVEAERLRKSIMRMRHENHFSERIRMAYEEEKRR